MSLSFVIMMVVITGAVALFMWWKKRPNTTLLHGLLTWAVLLVVSLGAIVIANALTDKVSG